jgi:hypothetical protein
VTERDDSLDGIIDILKEPAELRPGFTERVMAEIERLPAPEGSAPPIAAVPWWRRQWTVRMSPLRGLALAGGMAALLLAAVFTGWRAAAPAPETFAPETAGPAGQQPLQFVLVAPEASAVTLVGDFNDWSVSATPLRQAEGGVWTVTVPLPPGRYRYSFVVDGKVWRNDPDAASMEDEFGRPNSVVTVGGA